MTLENALCAGWEWYYCDDPSIPENCTSCGNGIVDPGEQCDLGEKNGDGNSGCDLFCTFTTYCGDGIVQDCEVCDDGNLV